jgi:cyclase
MAVREGPKWGTGLQEVGPDIYAYFQHDGSWGISNAGFLKGDDGLLVIDALMVASMAQAFIGEIRRVSDRPFRHLINTHSHPDHTGGNRFFAGAEIISHSICRAEILRGIERERGQTQGSGTLPPGPMATMTRTPAMTRMFDAIASDEGRHIVLPSVTYDDSITLRYGDTVVELHYYGPAHTFGDTLVYFPQHKLLFAGDVGFFYSTPLAGSGKIGGWLQVIDKVREMDVEVIVPGHGPPGGKRELDDVREYFEFVRDKAREGFDAGLTAPETVKKLDLGPYTKWLDSERIAANVAVLYREFRGEI